LLGKHLPILSLSTKLAVEPNFLTVMFVFAVLCAGLAVSEAKAFTPSGRFASSTKEIKQLKIESLKLTYKKSISKLEKKCAPANSTERHPCDVAIDGASALIDSMVSACNLDLNSKKCEDAQLACENHVWWVLFICSLFPGGTLT
jgi:hypothetical protein